MVEPSQKTNQLLNTIAKWANDAPLCECKRENIAYICQKKECCVSEARLLYCQECLQKGIHKHAHV